MFTRNVQLPSYLPTDDYEYVAKLETSGMTDVDATNDMAATSHSVAVESSNTDMDIVIDDFRAALRSAYTQGDRMRGNLRVTVGYEGEVRLNSRDANGLITVYARNTTTNDTTVIGTTNARLNGMKDGDQRRHNVRLDMPADIAPGDYEIYAVLTTNLLETDATNNTSSISTHGVTVEEAIIDVRPEVVDVIARDPLREGEKSRVRVQLTNTGNVRALGPTNVKIYLKKDGVDTLVGEKDFNRLALMPDRARNLVLMIDLPDGMLGGEYELYAVADMQPINPGTVLTANNTDYLDSTLFVAGYSSNTSPSANGIQAYMVPTFASKTDRTPSGIQEVYLSDKVIENRGLYRQFVNGKQGISQDAVRSEAYRDTLLATALMNLSTASAADLDTIENHLREALTANQIASVGGQQIFDALDYAQAFSKGDINAMSEIDSAAVGAILANATSFDVAGLTIPMDNVNRLGAALQAMSTDDAVTEMALGVAIQQAVAADLAQARLAEIQDALITGGISTDPPLVQGLAMAQNEVELSQNFWSSFTQDFSKLSANVSKLNMDRILPLVFRKVAGPGTAPLSFTGWTNDAKPLDQLIQRREMPTAAIAAATLVDLFDQAYTAQPSNDLLEGFSTHTEALLLHQMTKAGANILPSGDQLGIPGATVNEIRNLIAAERDDLLNDLPMYLA